MEPVIESARKEAERLRRILKSGTNRQVQSRDEKDLVRATAIAWFNAHRPSIAGTLGDSSLHDVDERYKDLLTAAPRSTNRTRYDELLKDLISRLGQLERVAVETVIISHAPAAGDETPPSFAPLVTDPRMQAILAARWKECSICVTAGANLAAIVMIGGLLEALLLARIQREPNKQRIVNASAAPKDRATGKTSPLNTWTLRDYIDVCHELGWISQTARDIGVVLRDYRNYIHPQKELTHGVVLSNADAKVLWEIAKSIARHAIAV